MKLLYEKIISPPDQSFAAFTMQGAVIDCEFHVHPEYELTFIESSFGTRFLNDDISEFNAGELNLIGSMVPHHFFNSPTESCSADWARLRVVQFREDFAGPALFQLPELAAVRRMLSDADCGLAFDGPTVETVRPWLNELPECSGALRLARLLELLHCLALSPYRKIAAPCRNELDSDGGARLNRAFGVIQRELKRNRQPALTAVAAAAGLSPEAFSRGFRRATGRSFIDYVIGLKIAKAANLLLHSDRLVSEICFESGFHNLANFNRQFIKRKKMTPREVRRRFAAPDE